MPIRVRLHAPIVVVVALVLGCSSDPHVEVSGAVTFDGKPLERGEIIFVAADGSVTPAGGPIDDGHYAVKMLPGPKKVMINASKLSAAVDPGTGERQEYSFIPPVYNLKTRLTANVEPNQKNQVTFDLKSKP
jgi:hypothetical protein